MSRSGPRTAAVVNLVLAACVLAAGTAEVVRRELLGWVWVGFGVALAVIALLWTKVGPSSEA